jgi:hypothetical protein
MPQDDTIRLEAKIDKLTEAVTKLVLIDERQIHQGQRLGKVEEDIAALRLEHEKLDRKVEKWINFGYGVYGTIGLVVAGGVTVYQLWIK